MKILLVNDNPVVNKLVTLSAQKTSDSLEIVTSVEEITSQRYDLLVLDDTLYSDELLSDLKDKIKYKKSLYICSRDADLVEGFSQILKKPFLPTDLVEIFALFGQESEDIDLGEDLSGVDDLDMNLENGISESLDELSDLDDIEDLDGLDDLGDLGDLGEIDDINDLDELNLEEELELDELEGNDDLGQSVLDDEEAQKVKELLDETEADDTILDATFDLEDFGELEEDLVSLDDELGELDDTKDELLIDTEEDESLGLDGFEDELSSSDDVEVEDESLELDELEDIENEFDNVDKIESEDESLELSDLDDELSNFEEEGTLEADELEEFDSLEDEPLEESLELDEELNNLEDMNDEILENIEEEDLESQIESAVEELSDEDLQSEIDEETLLDIVTGDIDPLDGLTSRDLKLAVGEEVEDIEEEVVEEFQELPDEDITEPIVESEEQADGGVEALKNLLTALNDKNVAASMKGMKISINITIGGD